MALLQLILMGISAIIGRKTRGTLTPEEAWNTICPQDASTCIIQSNGELVPAMALFDYWWTTTGSPAWIALYQEVYNKVEYAWISLCGQGSWTAFLVALVIVSAVLGGVYLAARYVRHEARRTYRWVRRTSHVDALEGQVSNLRTERDGKREQTIKTQANDLENLRQEHQRFTERQEETQRFAYDILERQNSFVTQGGETLRNVLTWVASEFGVRFTPGPDVDANVPVESPRLQLPSLGRGRIHQMPSASTSRESSAGVGRARRSNSVSGARAGPEFAQWSRGSSIPRI